MVIPIHEPLLRALLSSVRPNACGPLKIATGMAVSTPRKAEFEAVSRPQPMALATIKVGRSHRR
ncbi:hypothetical protein PS3A_36500 [Pseudomonas sp. 3A(2025)]